MLVHRRYNVPPMPNNLNELADIIHNFEPVRQFFKGVARGDDGSIAIIFINDSMLEHLRQCTVLFMDGTFDVCYIL